MPEQDFVTAIAAGNRYHAFMRGYRHRAGGKGKCPATMEHATLSEYYAAGYATACADINRASEDASKRYGYAPSLDFKGRVSCTTRGEHT